MDLTPGVRLVYMIAAAEATFLKSTHLEVEHFFLGLCKIDEFIRRETNLPEEFNETNKQALVREVAVLSELFKLHNIDTKQSRRRLRFLVSQDQKETGEFSGHRSSQAREMFEAAETISNGRQEDTVSLMALLIAILQTASPLIATLFTEYNIDANALAGDAQSVDEADEKTIKEPPVSDLEYFEEDSQEEHPLAKYGRDLTILARQGKLGPIIGRREEIKDIARILTQRSRNNPLLLGDPGVGKTAVIEGLALYAARDDAIDALKKIRIVEVTMSSLVAGTKYRGDFEDRIKELIDVAKQDENLVLFIDELHTLMGAGSVQGSLDASNILKPALGRGDISCIGASTTAEFRKFIEPDGALTRRFQLVWIDEPSYAETLEILKGLRPKLESHHGISILDTILDKVVSLTSRFLTDGFQPDKAIMVLDEACARRKLLTLGPVRPGMQSTDLELEDVGQVIARRTQVPLEVILAQDEERLLHIEEELAKGVVGQDHAIKAVAKGVRIARAGLKPPDRPVVLMFAGPTGTGKTELAKVLTKFLFFDSKRLIRLDMSEFMESHSISKIIGSPPGYIGFGEEPLFIREIRKYPYSVVLLDEVEKAHPSILLLFLQVFDEGRLTDARGRTINCSEAIFIMTSNLGTRVKVKPAIGFNLTQDQTIQQQEEAVAMYHGAIVKHLSPELVNRIQEIVVFKPLSQDAISKILDIYLEGTNKRLGERQITVEMDESAKSLLSQAGYSTEYGARYLKRVFDRWVTEPLSEHILSGKLNSGDIAHFTRLEDQMVLEVHTQSGVRTIPYSVDKDKPPSTE
jgi:ATP-dependent Clp protease ATP-binding subunit ClpC